VLANVGSKIGKPGTNLHRIYTIASVLEVIRAALATMYRRQVNHDQDHIERFSPVVAVLLFRRTSCSLVTLDRTIRIIRYKKFSFSPLLSDFVVNQSGAFFCHFRERSLGINDVCKLAVAPLRLNHFSPLHLNFCLELSISVSRSFPLILCQSYAGWCCER
jgi:hypothetical protein